LYAIIETGGKQYRVTEGDVVFLERLDGGPGADVRFDRVLACSNEGEMDFGSPYLDDVSVDAKIVGHGKDKKIVIFKYKAKKGYRKKQGHRQPYTKVRIESINASASVVSAAKGTGANLDADTDKTYAAEAVEAVVEATEAAEAAPDATETAETALDAAEAAVAEESADAEKDADGDAE
jgi:large subunit ribosomal protein L21